jgi:hypothetical protein
VLHRQLGQDAHSWAAEDRDPGGLYRGTRLASAAAWRSVAGNDQELTALEREFLDAAAAAEQAQLTAEQDERRRERRQNRRLRVLAAGLGVVLVAALAATGAAVVQRRAAVTQGRTAVARQHFAQSVSLATQSDSSRSENLSTSALQALAAWQINRNPTTRGSLLSREADSFLGFFPEAGKAETTALAISPDSRLLAVAEQPGTLSGLSEVQVWDLAARRKLAEFTDLGGVPSTLAFGPGGRTLSMVIPGARVGWQTWDLATHLEIPDPVQ